MAKRYSVAEARSQLPTIVDAAEAGQEIELTRRGKPVAVVVSLREYERFKGSRASFATAYRRFLGRHAVSDVALDDALVRTWRDTTAGRDVEP